MDSTPLREVTVSAREEALVPPPTTAPIRKRRVGAVALGLVSALGLGLAGGLNLHRLVDLDQTATWLQQARTALQSSFEVARTEVASRLESLRSGPAVVTRASESATPEKPNSDQALKQALTDLNTQLDQVRAASEASSRDLGQGIERLRSSADENQRELVAKIAQLGERIDRLEHQWSETATKMSQPVVQPVVAASKEGPKPAQLPAPDPKAKVTPKLPSTAVKPGMEAKGIANWSVRDVFDGTAILQGPRGTVEVVLGDTLPEIGRVQAIMRSGRRWAVATSKGVILPQ